MPPVHYRPFERDDWQSVVAFLTAEGEPTQHQAEVLASSDVAAWLALDAARLVGWVLTRPMQSDDGLGRGGVEDLVVAGAHRGRGIGRRLMTLAEAHHRERGFAGMQLTVRADNQPALRLYESMGYRPVQQRLRMWKEFA